MAIRKKVRFFDKRVCPFSLPSVLLLKQTMVPQDCASTLCKLFDNLKICMDNTYCPYKKKLKQNLQGKVCRGLREGYGAILLTHGFCPGV